MTGFRRLAGRVTKTSLLRRAQGSQGVDRPRHRGWRLLPTGLLMGLAFLANAVMAQPNLVITLASSVPTSGSVSTQSSRSQQLMVRSGDTISLARQSGRDYQLTSGGLYWTQITQVPADASSITMTPILEEDGSITVSVAVIEKHKQTQQSIQSTIVTQPGEWTAVYQDVPANTSAGRTYSTRSVTRDSLFLKIETR